MYESDEEYSFVVLSRVNSLKKVEKYELLNFVLGKTQKWKFIGR